MKPIVFIPEPISEPGLALLRPHCDFIAPWASSNGSSQPLTSIPDSADAVIVRLYKVDAAQLARAPRLKVIGKHGVGVDTIDVAGASSRKIPVVFTPTANANAVAEHAITMLLALARQIEPATSALRQGRFQDRTKFAGVELAGKTLTVLGLGRIGRRVAEIAGHGFAMRVLAYDPFVSRGDVAEDIELAASLDEALTRADFLTLHLPLSAETRHLLNHDRLKQLKPSCRLVNTSRGEVVDEAALADALANNQIAGAALDVFQAEPLPLNHPLMGAPNLLLTPHIASSTQESLDRMATDVAQGVLDVLNEKRPQHLVNPEVFL